MSARKTWSDNTIDERSIAFSSRRVNTHTHAYTHTQREYSLRPVCPVTQDLSFPPPFLPVLSPFDYHGLLSPSYPYVTLTYRVVGLRVRASCCIRSLNWVSIFTGWPTGARRERSNATWNLHGKDERLLSSLIDPRALSIQRKVFNYPIFWWIGCRDHRAVSTIRTK